MVAGIVAKQLGITPACAGRRTLNKEMIDRYEDHPRVCGEKFRL